MPVKTDMRIMDRSRLLYRVRIATTDYANGTPYRTYDYGVTDGVNTIMGMNCHESNSKVYLHNYRLIMGRELIKNV